MRRTVLAILVCALAGVSGCLTPDSKKQWNDAVGDLNGNNTKNIAPISRSRSSE